jgi:membrane-anchored protein YejM (alkaline phosphatase superfamily)
LALLQQLNRDHLESHPSDSRLEARIESYELAARMQLSAPELLDIAKETEQTHKAYGLDEEPTRDFGRNCLVARRMIERGVRFVQVWSGTGGASKNWDNHSDIVNELPFIAKQVDKPIAGLLTDLKARGLLSDTLVIWTTEFGRYPFTQGATGRDHNALSFVSWLCGAGVKPGVAYGASDEFSFQAVENKTYCYDLHATVLHLLGVDHERLTVRHNGIDRRLTDVHGHVIAGVLS